MINFLKEKYLLGVNPASRKIYLGELETKSPRHWNYEKGLYTDEARKDFTAVFNIGKAFDIESIDNDYIQNYYDDLWYCYDSKTKLELLDDGNKTKDEVFNDWLDDTDYHNIIDCSCTDFEIELNNGQIVNFETISSGQCDIRENQTDFENIIFTDKKAVLLLLELWDNYHLKDIANNKEVETKIKYIIQKLDKYNLRECENVENFIKANINEV